LYFTVVSILACKRLRPFVIYNKAIISYNIVTARAYIRRPGDLARVDGSKQQVNLARCNIYDLFIHHCRRYNCH